MEEPQPSRSLNDEGEDTDEANAGKNQAESNDDTESEVDNDLVFEEPAVPIVQKAPKAPKALREVINAPLAPHFPPHLSIRREYRNIPFYSIGDFYEMTGQLQTDGRVFHKKGWIPVYTPSNFNYTTAIMINGVHEGALYTFLRYDNTLATFIPRITENKETLGQFKKHMKKIQGSTTKFTRGFALNNFKKKLTHQEPEAFNNCQRVVNEIQFDLVKVLNVYLTENNYLGEGVTNDGHQQVFYRITDMVLAVVTSERLFQPEAQVNDPRPLRAIKVVKVINYNEFLEQFKIKIFT